MDSYHAVITMLREKWASRHQGFKGQAGVGRRLWANGITIKLSQILILKLKGQKHPIFWGANALKF